MNNELIRYQKNLKKALFCGYRKKQQLLSDFRSSLSAFLEDCPTPTYSQLADAFGPPEEVARLLMEHVSQAEIQHYHLWKTVQKSILILLAILVLLFGFYAYYLKEWTIITVHDEIRPVPNPTYQSGESK